MTALDAETVARNEATSKVSGDVTAAAAVFHQAVEEEARERTRAVRLLQVRQQLDRGKGGAVDASPRGECKEAVDFNKAGGGSNGGSVIWVEAVYTNDMRLPLGSVRIANARCWREPDF